MDENHPYGFQQIKNKSLNLRFFFLFEMNLFVSIIIIIIVADDVNFRILLDKKR